MSATLSAFLRSTTLRTTVSTSVSDRATVTENRSMELLQGGVRRERGLAGGDDEHLARKSGGAVLSDVLHLLGNLVVVVDELLHLVQHDERQGQLPGELLCSFRTSSNVSSMLGSIDVVHHRELLLEGLADCCGRRTEARARVDQGLGEDRRDVEVAKLVGQALALSFDGTMHLVVKLLLLHPQRQTGRAVLLREAGGVEHDAEKRQPHRARKPPNQVSRRLTRDLRLAYRRWKAP